MIGLLQRVSRASVTVDKAQIASIGGGLLVFIGVEKTDTEASAERLSERILGYRVFADEQEKMNLSVVDVNGDLLLVPQFTLVAATDRGMRPSFSSSAPPAQGNQLFNTIVDIMRRSNSQVQAGRFGADMAVELINDGPVTFWLQT